MWNWLCVAWPLTLHAYSGSNVLKSGVLISRRPRLERETTVGLEEAGLCLNACSPRLKYLDVLSVVKSSSV